MPELVTVTTFHPQSLCTIIYSSAIKFIWFIFILGLLFEFLKLTICLKYLYISILILNITKF